MAEDKVVTEETVEENEAVMEEETTEETTQTAAQEQTEEAQEEEVQEESADEGEAEEKKAKSIFKKKKDKKDEKIEELEDRVKRQMAEFDNFRKRTEKEKSQMFETGAKSILEKLLPVLDNFERGLQTVTEEQKEDAFAQGMDKIYKQMVTMLEEVGVTPIEAVGCEFDPNLHNAVMHIDDENFGENVIAEEFQKGYLYHETVIRHSMVKVAN